MSASIISPAAGLVPPEDVMTAAVRAAQSGAVYELTQLLETKAIVAQDRDSQGCTLLHWAAINGRTEIISLLLAHGADPSVVGGVMQETALQWGARHNHIDTMCQLLQADPTCVGHRNVEGRDALFLCVMQGNRRGLLLLVAHDADVLSTDSEGLSPVLFACKYSKDLSLIRTLLTLGADPCAMDAMGNSALHYVASNSTGQEGRDLVRTLRGADRKLCFRRNRDGKDPVALARDKGTTRLASYLARVRVVQRLPRTFVSCVPALMLATIISGFFYHGVLGAVVACVFVLSLLVRYNEPLSPRQHDCLGLGTTAVCLLAFSVMYFSELQGSGGPSVDVVFLSLAFLVFYHLRRIRMTPKMMMVDGGSGTSTSSGSTNPREALRRVLECKTDDGVLLLPAGTTTAVTTTTRSSSLVAMAASTLRFRRCCDGCFTIKAARSRHCLSCGRCARRFDHHCSFLGCCIGEANHQAFLFFLLCSSTALALWVGLAWKHLWKAGGGVHDYSGMAALAVRRTEVVVFALALACLAWLLAVTSFQLWLIGMDTTSFEYFRKQQARGGAPLSPRKWCRNVVRFLFLTNTNTTSTAAIPSPSIQGGRLLHHRPVPSWSDATV